MPEMHVRRLSYGEAVTDTTEKRAAVTEAHAEEACDIYDDQVGDCEIIATRETMTEMIAQAIADAEARGRDAFVAEIKAQISPWDFSDYSKLGEVILALLDKDVKK